jgi:hypothetical protein
MLKRLLLVVLSLIVVTAHAQFTPGQILTAAQLNGAFSNVLPIAGGTLTGPLTVPSLSVTGAPIPLASGGTGATTAIGATSSIQFLNSNSGASARAVSSKLQDVVNVLDFGADPTGATDSSTAFSNAAAALGTSGGIVRFRGWFLINSALTLPAGVVLQGDGVSVGQINSNLYTPANYTSALVLNPTGGITLGSRSGVENTLVLTTALAPGGTYSLPFANATVAANAVAAFSGTAFTTSTSSTTNDPRLENLLVLGFQYIFNGGSAGGTLNRPLFRRVYGDNTNGIAVQYVADIGRGEDLHLWPFTTVTLAQSTPSLFLRSGIGFFTGTGSTWFKWDSAFEFGYAIGHQVNGVNNVVQINCGAESASAVSNTQIGFDYEGAIAYADCINCRAASNGSTGFLLNTTASAGYNSVRLLAPVAYGNNATSGYVDVKSGNYSIIGGLFSDNSSVGHVQIESGAGAGTITGTTFANNASSPPVFGNATALANLQILNSIFTGTTSASNPNSLLNLTVSGQAILGGPNGAASMVVSNIANAVNYFSVGGSAAGGRPLLTMLGADTIIGMTLQTKGTGGEIAFFDGANGRDFSIRNPNASAAANYLGVYSALTTTAPQLYAAGADTNISVNVVPKGTGTLQVNGASILPNLSGTSGSIGGSALAAGACASGTVAVTNSTTSMAVVATPTTYPGDGIFWHGYVSAAGTVTVKVCASIAATPTASAYNVRVLQ